MPLLYLISLLEPSPSCPLPLCLLCYAMFCPSMLRASCSLIGTFATAVAAEACPRLTTRIPYWRLKTFPLLENGHRSLFCATPPIWTIRSGLAVSRGGCFAVSTIFTPEWGCGSLQEAVCVLVCACDVAEVAQNHTVTLLRLSLNLP